MFRSYDALSDLCTVLIVADGSYTPPLRQLVRIAGTALKNEPHNGDVVVITARALAIVLDKFSLLAQSLRTSKDGDTFKMCFSVVVSMVDRQKRELLHFEKSSESELKEEVLQCLSLSTNCGEVVDVVPSTEEQIQFCLSAVDGSKRTSCKVLQHCIGLMRQGGLSSVAECKALEELVHHHLISLLHLNIDHEWDDLLRAVVEGVLTYRVWGSPGVPSSVREEEKHSRVSGECSATTPAHKASMSKMVVLLLEVGERIVSSGTASSRVQLTLACLVSVVEKSLLPKETCESAMLWLAELLLRNEVRSANFSSPFSSGGELGAKDADQSWTGNTPVLPNLRWVVPPLLWSALVLLARMCDANFTFHSEYIWAWRGRNDEYHLYSEKVRRQLTAAYFGSGQTRAVHSGRHVIDTQSMTTTYTGDGATWKVHFQPIPSAISFDGGLVIPNGGAMLKGRICTVLRNALCRLSFGCSQLASLARSIQFYVICAGEPANTLDVITAFCTLPRDQKRPTVEEICVTLLKRDGRWAAVLQEAGVFDAASCKCLSPRARKRRKTEVAVLEVKSCAGGVYEPQGPCSDFLTSLRRTSPSELLSFVQGLEGSPYSVEQMVSLCEDIKRDDALSLRMEAAAQTYVLRVLHQAAPCKPVGKGLAGRLRDASCTISVCSAEDGTARSSGPKCPSGHSLRVHFSVTWECNVCGGRNVFGSLACRECDYDLCSDCLDERLSCMDTNLSAVVRDVIQSWRRPKTKRISSASVSSDGGNGGDSGDAEQVMLFTEKGVVPASRPVSQLQGCDVHVGSVGGTCRCCLQCPLTVACCEPCGVVVPCALQVFLRTFLAVGPQRWVDAAVELSIVSALEACGEDIFLTGVCGIPSQVALVVQEVAPHISLTFKRSMAHFLAVGCHRFGLYHLQDVGVNVRGKITGSISSNGLATKITVERNTESITKKLYEAFLEYPALRNKVEFNFEGEEGTGEGPTQELYAELSRRYRAMPELWHQGDDGACVTFPTTHKVHKEVFFVLGASCGRAFADGYMMDVGLVPAVWAVARSRCLSVEQRWLLLEELEPVLASSYSHVVRATDAELACMGLEDELSGEPLTVATAQSYVEKVIESRLENAILNIRWFALGVASVVDLDAFWFLTDEEMSTVFCGLAAAEPHEKLFSEEAFRSAVVEAHGYSSGSQEVEMLVSIVGGEFTCEQQRYFIEFLTGCPQLPLGGLDGLGRKITVVRKELEGHGEQTLPSCNTCFLYFKLPPYSTREIMRDRLLLAITEGRRNFSLS